MWQVLERVAGWFRTRRLDANRLYRFSGHSTTCSEPLLLDMAANVADARRNLRKGKCLAGSVSGDGRDEPRSA